MSRNRSKGAVSEKKGFTIGVKIRHPSWSALRLTEGMESEPDIMWNVGEKHHNIISGALLGIRTFTYWCLRRQIEGKRDFFAEFKDICEWLKTKKAFLDEILATGGEVAVDIGLRGGSNIGSSLGPTHLRLAAELGITLGIEVFPKMNPAEKNLVIPWSRSPGSCSAQSSAAQ